MLKIGIPVRIIVSKHNIEKGELELVMRDKRIKKNIKLKDVEKELKVLMQIFCK